MSGKFGLLFLVLVLIGAYDLWGDRSVTQLPGELVREVPRQEILDAGETFSKAGFSLTPLADFEVRARVLARERYRWDTGAKLAPIDLALGWGPMSDSTILDQLKIWQDGRWYQFRADAYPLPPAQLQLYSSNMHMIPADNAIEKALRKVRKGQVVHFKGKLVQVSRADGFTWRSSLTRSDTGSGACELVYVEQFEVE